MDHCVNATQRDVLGDISPQCSTTPPSRPATIETTADRELRELLHRVCAADVRALDILYRRTRPALYATARAVLRNTQDAEEIVNDVFHFVWREGMSFDPERGTAMRWLQSICRNRSIDRYRSRSRHAQIRGRLYDMTCMHASDVQEDQRSEIERGAAQRAVDGLPEARLTLLKLIYVDGLTFQEAADAQRLPVGTAKSHVRRCLHDLKVQLA